MIQTREPSTETRLVHGSNGFGSSSSRGTQRSYRWGRRPPKTWMKAPTAPSIRRTAPRRRKTCCRFNHPSTRLIISFLFGCKGGHGEILGDLVHDPFGDLLVLHRTVIGLEQIPLHSGYLTALRAVSEIAAIPSVPGSRHAPGAPLRKNGRRAGAPSEMEPDNAPSLPAPSKPVGPPHAEPPKGRPFLGQVRELLDMINIEQPSPELGQNRAFLVI